jgi:hypothetical protein
MKDVSMRYLVTAAIAAGVALSGCVTGSSAPTRFHMLAPLNEVKTAAPAGTGRTVIGIGPVVIPEYLNRPQIVTRIDQTSYQLGEFNRWAEPLGDNLTRVLNENLSILLADRSVDVLPSTRWTTPDCRVEIIVLQLDGTLGEAVRLIARWAVFAGDAETLRVTQRSVYQEKTDDATYQSLVLSQNRMVEALSREIAEALEKVLSGAP